MKELYLCAQIDKVITNEITLGNISMPSKKLLERGFFSIPVDKVVKSLKIHKNIAYQFLHFKGIFIYKSCNELIESEECPNFKISYGELKKPLDKDFSFNKIFEPYFLHTVGYKQDNFFEILFEKPIYINKVLLYTRNESKTLCYRANSLNVEITDESDHRYVIFSYLEMIRQFSKWIINKLTNSYCHNLFSNNEMNTTSEIILCCRNDCYYAISQLLHNLIGTSIAPFYILKYINEIILSDTAFKYSVCFGIKNNYFISYTDKDKNSYLSAGLYVISILKKLTPHVSFCFGSLLGFIREPDSFIPYDNDMDLMICFDKTFTNRESCTKMVYELLISNGINIIHNWSEVFHISYLNSARFDIFIFFEKDHYVNVSKRREVMIAMDDLFPTIDIKVLDTYCPIPKNPFKYLDNVYGTSWRNRMDADINVTQPPINCNEVIKLYENIDLNSYN